MTQMPSFRVLDELVALISSSVEKVKQEYIRQGVSAPSLDDVNPHPLDNITPTLSFTKAVKTIEGACAQLSVLVTTPQHTMTNRGMQMFESACLKTVISAKIADHLQGYDDGLSIEIIGGKAGIEPKKLSRIMRLLCTKHCFREISANVFANNRLSMMLLSENGINSLLGHFTDECYRSAGNLYDTLVDPDYGPSYAPNKTPFNRVFNHPGPLFDYFSNVDNSMGQRFSTGMIGWGNGIGAGALLTGFPWGDLPTGSTICDVGGGVGNISLQLARTFPHLHIILQDLEPTINQAKTVWQEKLPQALIEKRVDLIPMDFLKNSPVESCDYYYLKNIVHDWPDAECKIILDNVKKAMKPTSRLLIHEYILQHVNRIHGDQQALPQAPEPLLPNYGIGSVRPYYLDLDMMCMLNSKERTLDEFIQLGKESDFVFVKHWDFGETGVVEFQL